MKDRNKNFQSLDSVSNYFSNSEDEDDFINEIDIADIYEFESSNFYNLDKINDACATIYLLNNEIEIFEKLCIENQHIYIAMRLKEIQSYSERYAYRILNNDEIDLEEYSEQISNSIRLIEVYAQRLDKSNNEFFNLLNKLVLKIVELVPNITKALNITIQRNTETIYHTNYIETYNFEQENNMPEENKTAEEIFVENSAKIIKDPIHNLSITDLEKIKKAYSKLIAEDLYQLDKMVQDAKKDNDFSFTMISPTSYRKILKAYARLSYQLGYHNTSQNNQLPIINSTLQATGFRVSQETIDKVQKKSVIQRQLSKLNNSNDTELQAIILNNEEQEELLNNFHILTQAINVIANRFSYQISENDLNILSDNIASTEEKIGVAYQEIQLMAKNLIEANKILNSKIGHYKDNTVKAILGWAADGKDGYDKVVELDTNHFWFTNNDNSSRPNFMGLTLLHEAVLHKNNELIKYLIKKYQDQKRPIGDFFRAQSWSHAPVINRIFYESKDKPLVLNSKSYNGRGYSPVHMALIARGQELLQGKKYDDLLEHLSFSTMKKLLNELALFENTDEVISTKSLPYDYQNRNAAWYASYYGDAQMLEYLINQYTFIHKTSDNNYTPLHAAVVRNNILCVQLLLARNVPDQERLANYFNIAYQLKRSDALKVREERDKHLSGEISDNDKIIYNNILSVLQATVQIAQKTTTFGQKNNIISQLFFSGIVQSLEKCKDNSVSEYNNDNFEEITNNIMNKIKDFVPQAKEIIKIIEKRLGKNNTAKDTSIGDKIDKLIPYIEDGLRIAVSIKNIGEAVINNIKNLGERIIVKDISENSKKSYQDEFEGDGNTRMPVFSLAIAMSNSRIFDTLFEYIKRVEQAQYKKEDIKRGINLLAEKTPYYIFYRLAYRGRYNELKELIEENKIKEKFIENCNHALFGAVYAYISSQNNNIREKIEECITLLLTQEKIDVTIRYAVPTIWFLEEHGLGNIKSFTRNRIIKDFKDESLESLDAYAKYKKLDYKKTNKIVEKSMKISALELAAYLGDKSLTEKLYKKAIAQGDITQDLGHNIVAYALLGVLGSNNKRLSNTKPYYQAIINYAIMNNSPLLIKSENIKLLNTDNFRIDQEIDQESVRQFKTKLYVILKNKINSNIIKNILNTMLLDNDQHNISIVEQQSLCFLNSVTDDQLREYDTFVRLPVISAESVAPLTVPSESMMTVQMSPNTFRRFCEFSRQQALQTDRVENNNNTQRGNNLG